MIGVIDIIALEEPHRSSKMQLIGLQRSPCGSDTGYTVDEDGGDGDVERLLKATWLAKQT